jgi:hypothetical protein
VTWRGIDAPPDSVTYDAGISICPLPSNIWARWEKPADWAPTVREVARLNHGRAADSVSTTVGKGRSTTVGKVDAKTDQPRWVKETTISAPPVVDTSKTLVADAPEQQPEHTESSKLDKRRSPAVIEAIQPKIAPKIGTTADDDTEETLLIAARMLRNMPGRSDAEVALMSGASRAAVAQLRNH